MKKNMKTLKYVHEKKIFCRLFAMLKKIANTIRSLVVDSIEKAGSGHPGPPMECTELGLFLTTRMSTGYAILMDIDGKKLELKPIPKLKNVNDVNHLHLMVTSKPNLSPTQIVRRLKQESTICMWKLLPKKLEKHFWKEKTLMDSDAKGSDSSYKLKT